MTPILSLTLLGTLLTPALALESENTTPDSPTCTYSVEAHPVSPLTPLPDAVRNRIPLTITHPCDDLSSFLPPVTSLEVDGGVWRFDSLARSGRGTLVHRSGKIVTLWEFFPNPQPSFTPAEDAPEITDESQSTTSPLVDSTDNLNPGSSDDYEGILTNPSTDTQPNDDVIKDVSSPTSPQPVDVSQPSLDSSQSSEDTPQSSPADVVTGLVSDKPQSSPSKVIAHKGLAHTGFSTQGTLFAILIALVGVSALTVPRFTRSRSL